MNAGDLATFLAAFARSAAFLYSAPVTGSPNVPGRLRAGAAAAIALAVAAGRPPLGFDDLALAIPADVLLGLIAGFAARIVFAGAESGGQLIGLQFGLGLAAFFDPIAGEQALVTRRIALCLAGLAFITVGGLEASIRAVAAAPAEPASLMFALRHVIDRSGEILVCGLRFAAPAMVAGLIANVGVALASRAAPALNLFSVMLAALFIVGGVTLIATAPALIRETTVMANRVAPSITEAVGP